MYDLETGKVIEEIKKTKSKMVCIQLPDGLKLHSGQIQKEIEEKTKAKVIIWGGSCFGSCDLPMEVKKLGVDLLVHYGHAAWQDSGSRDYGKIELSE